MARLRTEVRALASRSSSSTSQLREKCRQAAKKDWSDQFGEVEAADIQTRLEESSGAVLLRGFPIELNSTNSTRDAFKEWCAKLGTLLSQNEKGDIIFDVTMQDLERTIHVPGGPIRIRNYPFIQIDVTSLLFSVGSRHEAVARMSL